MTLSILSDKKLLYMKQLLLSIVCFALLSSCTHNVDNREDRYLASYRGKYLVNEDSHVSQLGFTPNLTILLTLMSNNKCEVNAGINEWPIKTEVDILKLNYQRTDSGLVLYDSDPSVPRITVKAKDIHPECNDEQDIVNYLGAQIELQWHESLGATWDKYATAAHWPMELTISWVDSGMDDTTLSGTE